MMKDLKCYRLSGTVIYVIASSEKDAWRVCEEKLEKGGCLFAYGKDAEWIEVAGKTHLLVDSQGSSKSVVFASYSVNFLIEENGRGYIGRAGTY
jgi:hypothetical protein